MVALGNENRVLEEQLASLSFRALLALGAACAEWTYRRFVGVRRDPELAELIEAVWVASWDFRHLRADRLSFPRMPEDTATNAQQVTKGHLAKMCNAYALIDFGIVGYARSSAALVSYMTAQPKPFQTWFKTVVKRMQDLSEPCAAETCGTGLFDDDPRGGYVNPAVWGTPVARQWFATNWQGAQADFDRDMALLLANVDPASNRFLHTEAELKARGVAHPYTVG
jgi:hypothetical protein